MVVKDRYAVQLPNKNFIADEDTNTPRIFTTKRAAYLIYGPDAVVVAVRCTFEVIPKTKRK